MSAFKSHHQLVSSRMKRLNSSLTSLRQPHTQILTLANGLHHSTETATESHLRSPFKARLSVSQVMHLNQQMMFQGVILGFGSYLVWMSMAFSSKFIEWLSLIQSGIKDGSGGIGRYHRKPRQRSSDWSSRGSKTTRRRDVSWAKFACLKTKVVTTD